MEKEKELSTIGPAGESDGVATCLQVRCPHCRRLVELADDATCSRVVCSLCGEPFSFSDETRQLTLSAGDRIGHFELQERVGIGGFGIVWRAHDTELDRVVAIKESRRTQLSDAEVERVLREARAAAQLQHPNIVSTHEVGRDGDRLFIVTEFVAGVNLADMITAARPPLREAVTLSRKIADALQHAHAHGVIHRDLKPHNVMVDDTGEPRLLDFGLAKRESGEVTMTREGELLGTPAYMSPEQARGSGHEVDRRADIYSLGVVLYQLCVGELPFRGTVRMLLNQILNDEPPSPRRLDSQLPRDLEVICLKCLEKDQSKRYQTAAELAEDLGRWLDGRPIVARPVGRPEKAVRLVKRYPVVSSLVTALLLSLVSGLGVVSWQLGRTLSAQRETRLQKVETMLAALPDELAPLMREVPLDSPEVEARLRRIAADKAASPTERLRSRVALLPREPTLVDYAFADSLSAPLPELFVLREAMRDHKTAIIDQARKVLEDTNGESPNTLNAAALLALSDEPPRWLTDSQLDTVSRLLVDRAARVPSQYRTLGALFGSTDWGLRSRLTSMCTDPAIDRDHRSAATNLLNDYFLASATDRARLLCSVDPWQYDLLFRGLPAGSEQETAVALKSCLSQQAADDATVAELSRRSIEQANAAVGLTRLGFEQEVEELLAESEWPATRAEFIKRYRSCGGEPQRLIDWLASTGEPGVTQPLVLALGEFIAEDFPDGHADAAIDTIGRVASRSSDLGLRSASWWTLRRLGSRVSMEEFISELRADVSTGGWMMTSEDHVLAVVEPQTFWHGACPGDATPDKRERPAAKLKVSHRYGIAILETTTAQFRRFRPGWTSATDQSRSDYLPVDSLSWQSAAAYCNWLSEREGLAPKEHCYVTGEDGLLRSAPDARRRIGYRLPEEFEWECACRAGSATPRFYGWSTELTRDYAVRPADSLVGAKLPVASKRPNGFGLFDIYGNADELCHSIWRGYAVTRGGAAGDVTAPSSSIYDLAPPNAKPGPIATGFRIAKTIGPP